MRHRALALAFALAAVPLASASAAPFIFTGAYSQDFNTLGANGTTLTTVGSGEFTVWRIPGGANTWTAMSGVTPADLSNGVLVDDTNTAQSGQAPLGKFYSASFPTFTRFGGVNGSRSTDPNDPDRWLGTSPTGVAGTALQLALTNGTGMALNSLSIGFDTTNLSVGLDELPGYRFFYSLTGETGTWISASALDAVTTENDPQFTLRNTAGTLNLGSGWTAGSTLLLRLVDDNGFQGSPDQMLAIDNVSVATQVVAVPEPATWAMMIFGFGAICSALRRRGQPLTAT